MKEYKTAENKTIKRVSRWIKIRHEYVTKRHSLYDYAANNDDCLSYFIHNGCKYAIDQFMRLTYPIFFENEDGKTSFICGYDSTNYFKPFLLELDDAGEYVRLFEEI